MANGYKNEVFVSYKRADLRLEWIKEFFMPLLKEYLQEEIPRAEIFIDYEMESGNTWPARLADELSRSKVLIGLWNKPYFDSEWCKTELSLMYARERKCGFNTPKNPQRLIIPATLHDGEDFPYEARLIQQKPLQNHSHFYLAKDSKTKSELSKIIRCWVPDIVKAIGVTPAYNAEWATLAYHEFMETFRLADSEQMTVPSMGN